MTSQIVGKTAIALTIALGAIAFFTVTPVRAQDATLPTKEVNITLNEAPVRTALDTLFKSAGLNYTIDPTVSGLVTVSLRAVPFDVALRSILRSCDPPLAYTVDDDIYDIHPRTQAIDISGAGTQAASSSVTSQPVTSTEGPDASTQIVQLKLNYANALLLMRYALTSTDRGASGVIPALTSTSSGNQGGQGGGMSSGMGGMSSGMGGMSGGSMGGMSSGMGGMSSGMGGMSGGSMGGMSGGSMSF